jgi:CRISPR-associated endonuclease Csn1
VVNISIIYSKPINCSDLFFNNKFDFEHTIPASISFDDELKNLTIAEVVYNREIKQNRIPTELVNYDKEAHGYSAIKPRLNFMFEKVEALEKQYIEWKNKTKFASTKDIKDACIQRQHYIKFDLNYWRYKVKTFTCTEYKAGWRNNQLRDTQVITKYALPYLKTVFNKVEVEKGTITDKFKEIYKIKLFGEKKDRSLHSHHAIDAATLTLIPPASIRDKILKKYEEVKDLGHAKVYHESVRQWAEFQPNYLLSISNDTLINFQPQYRTLIPTYKNVRKRGKQQFVEYKDDNGKWHYTLDTAREKIPLKAKGDSVRGQLHKETFFGVIKMPEYDEKNGKYVPKTDSSGNFIFQINEKRKDEFFIVTKVPITSFSKPEDFEIVIDPNLKRFLIEETTKRVSSGQTFADAIYNLYSFNKEKDKHGIRISPIRHVRCKVKSGGGGYVTNPAVIKENFSYPPSKKEYKQRLYALNGETVISAFYEDVINGEIIRVIEPYSILQVAESKGDDFDHVVPPTIEHIVKKTLQLIPLCAILKIKQKVIFYENDKEELKKLPVKDLSQRLYLITKFEDGRISFKHHLNAMSEDELKVTMKNKGLADVGASYFNFDDPIPKLRLSKAAFNFAIEGKYFDIMPDGSIKWKY